MRCPKSLVCLLICVGFLYVAAPAALAGEADAAASATSATPSLTWILWVLAPVGALLALVFAFVFSRQIVKYDEGTEQMASIAGHVRAGANAYLRQQYKIVTCVVIVLFVIFLLMAFVQGMQNPWMPFAFLAGAFFSGLCGFLGMRTATNASARTTNAARTSLNGALQVSFRAGSVMGLIVVGFALLNICVWFLLMYLLGVKSGTMTLSAMTVALLSSGMGASTQALFARVGGGIFTKAADVGADLVGKIEAGIPEDDPRNPATIADNVGDNVGDVAGMGADLFESYANSILASGVLGVAAALTLGSCLRLPLLIFPMALAGIGCIASVAGIYLVRTREDATQKALLHALTRGEMASALLFTAGSALLTWLLFRGLALPEGFNPWGIWLAVLTGLVAGVIIGKSTEYYTSADFRPTRAVAHEAKTGAGTVIIGGLACGMLSTWLPVIAVVVGIIASFGFAGGFQNPALGLYGVAIAAVGMLSTLGIMLSTDAYGPIADNAGGNAEMAGLPPEVRERTDALDSLGNTTAAVGKGFAIGSAALTALALIAALMVGVQEGLQRYIHESEGPVRISADCSGRVHPENEHVAQIVRTKSGNVLVADVRDASLTDFASIYNITLVNPKVLAGMFLGAMLPFLFCSLTMKAVGRAASDMVEEVRRQFRELGILEGKGEPDYKACVAISTKGAQKAMMAPSLLALVAPVAVGLVLGVPGLTGMLTAALAAGFVLAVMMANAGGAWDNAKKWIETGELGGKGSDAHKAAVVGDTVGDPFKDTSGPSLNILIKLMSMVAVVFAGLIVQYALTL
ncbi:MAG: sodium-translocating pyrophosphatase [Planctomycetota bacterium]